jgi:hypothetical protein|tara:strand:- start:5234 stop:6073 length:840 start_codon:yes stop_codon:yes gene_type:complete
MATRTWTGAAGDGDWGATGNWAETTVPINGDDVYFVSGSANVTTGLNQSGVTLGSLNFGTKWTGSISTELQINSTTVDYANKIGVVYLKGTYTTINVQATSADNPALNLNDSTITTLRITGGSGTIYIADGTTLSGEVSMIGCKNAKLEIQSGATVSAADITIDAGQVVTYEELDTIVQYGGTVTMQHAAGTTNTITMYKGVLKYQPTANVTLTTLTVYGGYFDMRGCNAPTHTLTNSTIYSGSMIDERNGLSNATYTNPITSNGGVFMPDLGRSIAVS